MISDKFFSLDLLLVAGKKRKKTQSLSLLSLTAQNLAFPSSNIAMLSLAVARSTSLSLVAMDGRSMERDEREGAFPPEEAGASAGIDFEFELAGAGVIVTAASSPSAKLTPFCLEEASGCDISVASWCLCKEEEDRERERRREEEQNARAEVETEVAPKNEKKHFFPSPFCLSFPPTTMRSSSVLSSRRCGPSASSCRHGASPARVAAALLHRRPLRSGVLPLTTTNSMTTLAISGDDTGLITALSSAPPEAVAALGAGASAGEESGSKCVLAEGGRGEKKGCLFRRFFSFFISKSGVASSLLFFDLDLSPPLDSFFLNRTSCAAAALSTTRAKDCCEEIEKKLTHSIHQNENEN